MVGKMKILAVLRDTADERIDLVKQAPETDRYTLRFWKYPVGVQIARVQEITMERHEVIALMALLIDEVEEWRVKEVV